MSGPRNQVPSGGIDHAASSVSSPTTVSTSSLPIASM